MKVIPIATTLLTNEFYTETPWTEPADSFADNDSLAEFSGRVCYQSWKRPNPATATNKGYLSNIQKQQHFSVLEHASITFYVEGVSRAFTHELIRHRHLSFSQLSQRYVDSSDVDMIPAPGAGLREKAIIALVAGYTLAAYDDIVSIREAAGATRKQAREAARRVLPNATETKIVVTGNIRAWREMLQKRGGVNDEGVPYADAEFYEFAKVIYSHLHTLAPNATSDLDHLFDPEHPEAVR